MSSYKIIGLMSGTSLDGLDICYASFNRDVNNQWKFEIIQAETMDLTLEITQKIQVAKTLSALDFVQLDIDLATFFSKCINQFIHKYNLSKNDIDAIASHGQTIFHQPSNGFTIQLGNPLLIAVKTGIQVIGDFRSKDVFYGGQGAPLVPVGDKELFYSKAEACVNIGGFVNVSYVKNNEVLAYDVCTGNLPMNYLMSYKNLAYDNGGNCAKSGKVNFFLLDLLNSLPYFSQDAPKSLGTEWLETAFLPLIKGDKNLEDNLRTLVEHTGLQIAESLNKENIQSAIFTGGGAKNTFLMERIAHYFKGQIVEVDEQIIDFKEALIFGFLAVLNLENEPNCLSSVTGASIDVIGGTRFQS